MSDHTTVTLYDRSTGRALTLDDRPKIRKVLVKEKLTVGVGENHLGEVCYVVLDKERETRILRVFRECATKTTIAVVNAHVFAAETPAVFVGDMVRMQGGGVYEVLEVHGDEIHCTVDDKYPTHVFTIEDVKEVL